MIDDNDRRMSLSRFATDITKLYQSIRDTLSQYKFAIPELEDTKSIKLLHDENEDDNWFRFIIETYRDTWFMISVDMDNKKAVITKSKDKDGVVKPSLVVLIYI